MGYAYYRRAGPDGVEVERGYAVSCTCHCGAQIDRGLAYLCYRCTRYFCGAHLTITEVEQMDSFAGSGYQVCFECAEAIERGDDR